MARRNGFHLLRFEFIITGPNGTRSFDVCPYPDTWAEARKACNAQLKEGERVYSEKIRDR